MRCAFCLIGLWVTVASAAPTRILALASELASCEAFAGAMRPYGIEMVSVEPNPEVLTAIASDGRNLSDQYKAVFIQAGVIIPAEFCAILGDAVTTGMGLLFEGGQGGIQNEELLKYLPAYVAEQSQWRVMASPGERVHVKDPTSPLLWQLGWGTSPPVSAHSIFKAREGTRVVLTVGDYPLLMDWISGQGRVVLFAGTLTGPDATWPAWRSWGAFRARLLSFAGGMPEKDVKLVVPKHLADSNDSLDGNGLPGIHGSIGKVHVLAWGTGAEQSDCLSVGSMALNHFVEIGNLDRRVFV